MIWIGVHYEYPFGGMTANRPEWKPKGAKDWRRDLEMIKDTGFNMIRIRVGLDSHINDVATLLDICGELDIKVEFGFAMFYVSNEFVNKYPDSKTVLADGRIYPRDELDYSWPRACVHHPLFRSRRDEYVDACASRFKDHPSIIAWDIHNEPSLRGCYCDNTLAVYHDALGHEFGGVDAYNNVYGTSFAGLTEVVPPRKRDENIEAFRHWRTFITAELNRFLNEGKDIVRRHVPHLPITYNPTVPFKTSANGQDWWNLRDYELMSCSHYCGSGEKTPGLAVNLELLKALGPGRDVWIAEFQGGGFVFDKDILYTGKQMVLELNGAFAHDIQGVIYYRWDPLLTGPEPWINGMTEVDSYDTEKRLTLKKGITELRQHEAILDTGKSIPPSVGIFLTRDHLVHSSEHGYDLAETMYGSYSMLSALGYETAVVLDEFDPVTCPYDAMIFPYMYNYAQMVPAIMEYAKSGRKAIVELPVGNVEEAGAVGAEFGLVVTGREQPNYWFVGWDLRGTDGLPGGEEGQYTGFAAHERLFLDAGKAKILMSYGLDGRPAIVAPDGCEGNVLAFGFPLGRTHAKMLHHYLRNFVGEFLGQTVKPDIVVKGMSDEYRPMIEARAIETDSEGLLFIINRGLYDYDLEVAVKGYESVKIKAAMYSVVKQRMMKPC